MTNELDPGGLQLAPATLFAKALHLSKRLSLSVVLLLVPIYLIVLPWTGLPDAAMKAFAPVLPWAFISSAFTDSPFIGLVLTFAPLLALSIVVCWVGSHRWQRFVAAGVSAGVCYGLLARMFLACIDIA